MMRCVEHVEPSLLSLAFHAFKKPLSKGTDASEG